MAGRQRRVEWRAATVTAGTGAAALPEARFVWSEGLDWGAFGGRQMDCYQKDLPLEKAVAPEVLVAYAINGDPLRKERGGPVRLVVPGWFGTNSTKWVWKLSLQAQRAPSPFTTVWYNERDHTDSTGTSLRPVWAVEPNSMITSPAPDAHVGTSKVEVYGWTWSADGIGNVSVGTIEKGRCVVADVAQRKDFSWQQFNATLELPVGKHQLMARATCLSGVEQPLTGRRNHVHIVEIKVSNKDTEAEPR